MTDGLWIAVHRISRLKCRSIFMASVDGDFWVARAMWYCSLSLSIWAIIASLQQNTLLSALPPRTVPSEVSKHDLDFVTQAILKRPPHSSLPTNSRESPIPPGPASWAMLYVWQSPLMLMSYAWVMFLIALTLHVCTPLIEKHKWGNDTKACSTYLYVLRRTLTALSRLQSSI